MVWNEECDSTVKYRGKALMRIARDSIIHLQFGESRYFSPFWKSFSVFFISKSTPVYTRKLHTSDPRTWELWRPPPRSHVGAHTIKRAVSVCPHFLASISCFRLLSQDRKLCFCRLRVKVARSRRQIKNHQIYHLR